MKSHSSEHDGNLLIETFYHRASGTLSYVVADKTTKQCLIIDPCMDFDIASGEYRYASAIDLVDLIQGKGYTCQWILETHAHADHLTAAQWLQSQLGCHVAIGQGITDVQKVFKAVFNLGDQLSVDGSQFDRLLCDGEVLELTPDLSVRVMATPGHTSDSVTYLIGNHAFIGDTLFAPHRGTARCDFPGGSAEVLYQSIQKLYALPDSTQLHLCHDYPSDAESLVTCVTVQEQKQKNSMCNKDVSLSEYVNRRESRDKNLAVPKLLYPSVQVNIRAGCMPESESNGTAYLKIPLKSGVNK